MNTRQRITYSTSNKLKTLDSNELVLHGSLNQTSTSFVPFYPQVCSSTIWFGTCCFCRERQSGSSIELFRKNATHLFGFGFRGDAVAQLEMGGHRHVLEGRQALPHFFVLGNVGDQLAKFGAVVPRLSVHQHDSFAATRPENGHMYSQRNGKRDEPGHCTKCLTEPNEEEIRHTPIFSLPCFKQL